MTAARTTPAAEERPEEGAPMTQAERDRVVAEMIADPAKVRREIEAEIRLARPDVTQAQLDAEWGLVEATLGL